MDLRGFCPAVLLTLSAAFPATGAEGRHEYKLLATSKTSTMEKELNQAAAAGFRFEGVMGGETSFGGKEVVSILGRPVGGGEGGLEYKLLATNKTSTMQKELSEVAEAAFVFKGVTVGQTAFGGREVVVITERSLRR